MNIGVEQQKLLNWLENFCINDRESNICFIEGFSGLGKTKLAVMLQTNMLGTPGFKVVNLKLQEGSFSFDDFLLDLAADFSNIGISVLENAIFENKSPLKAIQNILIQEKVCIIIDAFQNILIAEGQIPIEIKRMFEAISISNTAGKIIALTNHVIERGNWCDQINFKQFPSFSDNEAVIWFDELLKERNITLDVSINRKTDLVISLGKNPRAINVFVQCLTWGTLDELIGELPEIWEARDREFSEELLLKLEEALIKKSLMRFTDAEIKILENLSAMRKPFMKEAIERMNLKKAEATRYREKYTQFYFLEKNSNWFNLHPVLKEICKNKLSASKYLFRTAHSMAAEYYTRHFFHKELKSVGKLGGYFVEARYHLLMAESAEKLSEISKNFEQFIHATIKSVSPIPKDPQLLNERIALLTAYLGSGGPAGLEFHLAKCLKARGLNEDIKQALLHSERSVGQSASVEAWLLYMHLDAAINGLLSAINIGYIAKGKIPASNGVASLYQACAELMEKDGQVKDAIVLLKEGIGKIPASQNSFALYQACAELMEKDGQVKDAIVLLKEGIGKIPASNSVASLYQACAELMEKDGQVKDAIVLLKEGIGKIPASQNSFALYQACAELMEKDGQVKDAIVLLKEGIGKIPASNSVASLYQACAELMEKDGQVKDAIVLLKEGIGKIPASNNSYTLYQACAELMEKDGQVKDAIVLLKEGIGKIPASNNSYTLYQACAELMEKDGQVKDAIVLLKEGIGKIPASNAGYKLFDQLVLYHYRMKNVLELASFSQDTNNKYQSCFAQILKSYSEDNYSVAIAFSKNEDIKKSYISIRAQIAFGLLCEGCFNESNLVFSELQNPTAENIGYAWICTINEIKNKKFEKAQKYSSLILKDLLISNKPTEKDLVKYWWESRNEKYCPAYYYPHLPTKLTGFNKELSIASKTIKEDLDIFLERELQETDLNSQTNLKILCVATEWFSKNGGLSSFNRQLCLTLASLQHKVYCLVPSFSVEEGQNALEGRVALIKSTESAGVREIDRLNLKPELPSEFLPDLIIGHDRITGPSMNILRRDFFPTSRTILFIHTSPGEIEWYKPIDGDKSMTQKADERERIQLQLAKDSDLVVAVGQKLFNEMSTQLSGLTIHPEIVQFTPGLFDYGNLEKEVAQIPFCLLLGRVEDFKLKGVDIAAKALDDVYGNLNHGEKPAFIIRGAVAGTGDELQKRVKGLCHSPLEVRVKEYNPDEEILKEDIRRASIVLMPSITEGFGLVGLEAISLNCPILISHNSGLAKLIEQAAPNESHHWVVKTTGDINKDSKAWSKEIEFILNDRSAANTRIKKTVDLVKKSTSWKSAIQTLIEKYILQGKNNAL